MMKEACGEPLAAGLIGRMPPVHITDIATEQDVENSAVLLRGEMAELRGEMSELLSDLRGEMSELRSELRSGMPELRSQFRGDLTDLRAELRSGKAELRGEFRVSSRHTMVTIIAASVSIWLTFHVPHVI